MSTQEIANRLVELCRKGDYETCYKELYSPNAASIEADDSFGSQRVEGMEAIRKKGEAWGAMIEEMHGSSVGDPIVAGNCFSCTMMVDWTMKGMGRQKMEEICVYKVEDGKIVSEQFFS
jgi:hypothetical protein